MWDSGLIFKLNLDEPADCEVAKLIEKGLVELSWDEENDQLCVGLSDKAREELAIDSFIDSNDFETFLKESKKVLDKFPILGIIKLSIQLVKI